MLNFFPELLRDTWRFLLIFPMPWRAEIVIWVIVLVSYQLLYRFSVLLLLPEFWLTNWLRLRNLKPLPGTFIFNKIVEIAIKISSALRWIILPATILGLILWYSQELTDNPTFFRYIDQVIEWWDSLEDRILME